MTILTWMGHLATGQIHFGVNRRGCFRAGADGCDSPSGAQGGPARRFEAAALCVTPLPRRRRLAGWLSHLIQPRRLLPHFSLSQPPGSTVFPVARHAHPHFPRQPDYLRRDHPQPTSQSLDICVSHPSTAEHAYRYGTTGAYAATSVFSASAQNPDQDSRSAVSPFFDSPIGRSGTSPRCTKRLWHSCLAGPSKLVAA